MRDYCRVIKLYSFFLFLIISAFLFSSCGSSDTSQENSNANSTNTRPPTTSGANVTPLTSPTQASTAQPLPSPSIKPSPSPSVSPSPSKTDGVRYFNSKGIVTKINMELGSVELDHEDIPGLMPAMIMEFYVKDKQMLVPLKVGDKVEFTIEEKNNTEIISAIKKR